MLRHLTGYARRRQEVSFVALEEMKPEWSRLVEVKYFLGLTDEEAAEALGMKPRSMQRMRTDARQFLFSRTQSGHATHTGA